MNAMISIAYTVVFFTATLALGSSSSPERSVLVNIDENSSLCARTVRADRVVEWRCPELQSALETVASLGNDSAELNCVSISVPPGDHYVTQSVYFAATNLHFVGGGKSLDDTTIFCNYTAGVNESRIFDLSYNYTDYTFYFDRSQAVSFDKVQFVGCPYPIRVDTVADVKIHNSTFRNFTEAVFDIFNCATVSIVDSNFINNTGTGISRHSFRANTGAVSIGYNNAPISFPSITANVLNCTFVGNRATAVHKVRSTSSAFFSRIFTGRGGGLGFFFNESFHNASVKLCDNLFEKNYARSFGGALYLVTFGAGTQNMYTLERNRFLNNFGPLGGGAISNTFFSRGVVGSPHSLLMIDCSFTGNIGQTGGAASLYLPYEAGGVSYVRCERCNFTGNSGLNSSDEYGAAVALKRIVPFENRENIPKYDFIDCTFERNYGVDGIFTLANLPLLFSGHTKFVGNKGTDALKIIGALVEFSGRVMFRDNADVRTHSVALHLDSFAQIRLIPGLHMTFSRNNGTYGASILVNNPTASNTYAQLAYNPLCFMLYEDKSLPPKQWDNVTVSFHENEAILGSSLLIFRMESCSWVSLNDEPNFSNLNIYNWPIWDFGNDSNLNTAYVDTANLKHSFATMTEYIVVNNQSVRAWPGQEFIVQLTGQDQFLQRTTIAARFSLFDQISLNGTVINFEPALVVNYATPGISLVRNFKITYSVSSGEILNTDGLIGNVTIDDPIQDVPVSPAMFTLYPALCPAGYQLTPISNGLENKGLICQCNPNNPLIIQCESDGDRIVVQEGYWGAAVISRSDYHYHLFLHPCPPDYCKCSQNTSLGTSICAFAYTNSDPDAQCTIDRQGALCGECRDGKGVSALLNRCVSCPNAYGLLILGLFVVDIVAFIAITVADSPLPEWIYPYIFYIQAVPSVAAFFPLSFSIGGKFLFFISSAFSFYFVYDFCLYGSMSPLVSYFIKYLPVFTLIALLPAVCLFRQRKWMMLDHHGIWSIILLLYTHLVVTSTSILQCPSIPYDNSSTPRWFVSGNIGCFTGWHIPLALLAITGLVLAVLLIPLAYLISQRWWLLKKFYWLKYFEHALTHAYKEQWKWWSAIELARRFIFVLFVVPFPGNSIPPIIVVCIMMVVYGLAQPYKNKATNIVEMILQIIFFILLALESTSFEDTYNHLLSLPGMNNSTSAGISTIAKVLLSIYYFPVLLLVITVTVQILINIRKWKLRPRKARSLSLSYRQRVDHVTMTEIKLQESGDYVRVTDVDEQRWTFH